MRQQCSMPTCAVDHRSDLAFNYKLGRRLGAGASAEVFQAKHIITDDLVAIKVFTDSRSETIHAACAEFVCAMRSASPSALQYFELAFLKGKPALVMELGQQALEDWIKVRAEPSLQGRAAQCASSACQ